jgi:hypothetical protein
LSALTDEFLVKLNLPLKAVGKNTLVTAVGADRGLPEAAVS